MQPHGCWVWQLKIGRQGYGNFAARRRIVRAHRFAYELAYGPIPDGYVVDHLCHNKACVRPDHLDAVLPSVNKARAAVGCRCGRHGRRLCAPCEQSALLPDLLSH
jgi:hypothetical protein